MWCIEEMQQFEGQYVTTEKDHEQLLGARSNIRKFCGHKMIHNKEMDRRAQHVKEECT
jgi:tRNA A58 N-methylase Trm61